MGSLRRSSVWSDPRIKPPFATARVNWSHPLARGLVAAFVFSEGAGSALDLAYGRRGTLNGNAAWTVTQRGKAVVLDGTGDFVAVPDDNDLDLVRPFQIFVLFRRTGNVADYQGIIGKRPSGDVLGYWLSCSRNANGDATFGNGRVWFAIDNISLASSAQAVADDSGFHTVLVQCPVSGRELFVDGRSVASDGMTGSPSATAAQLQFGREQVGSSTELTGEILAVYIWRFVHLGAALWLNAEPYTFFQSVIQRRWEARSATKNYYAGGFANAQRLTRGIGYGGR